MSTKFMNKPKYLGTGFITPLKKKKKRLKGIIVPLA